MAGGITLTPLSIPASPAMAGSAATVADGADGAGFGSILSLAMASVGGGLATLMLGNNSLSTTSSEDGGGAALKSGDAVLPSFAGRTYMLASSLCKPAKGLLPDKEGKQIIASSDDVVAASQVVAAGVLAQLMVASNGMAAIQPQPNDLQTEGENRLVAGVDGGRSVRSKVNVLAADVKAGLRQMEGQAEHDVDALDSLATDVAAASVRKHDAENFAAAGNILPERKVAPELVAAPDAKLLMAHGAVSLHETRTPAVVTTPSQVVSVVGRPGWGEELGQKMLLMVRGNQQSAELQLNPPNLGPLEVRLSLQNDQASLMFVSAHSSVRDAINAALPKLSSMFAESGISMGSVLVGDQSLAQQQNQSQRQFEQQPKRSGGFAASAADATVQRFDLPISRGQGWAVSMFV